MLNVCQVYSDLIDAKSVRHVKNAKLVVVLTLFLVIVNYYTAALMS